MVDTPPARAETNRFSFVGSVAPLSKGTASYAPKRRLGGWLATYGKLGPNGGVVPTEDREGHTFEAARTIGRIDFSAYQERGLWNDTHHFNGQAFVGVPTLLEHHDEESPLAKSHGKVGWWTEGHLWDRDDARSWQNFTDYVPNEVDLQRADYYWNAANLLKGVPRDLGFSAHGKMLLSPCGKRIIWAAVTECAVCELPQNPDATAQVLHLAVPVTSAMLGAAACERCACPPNLRCPPLVADRPAPASVDRETPPVGLSKAVTTTQVAPLTPQSFEGAAGSLVDAMERDPQLVEQLTKLIAAKQGCSESAARRWLQRWAKARNKRKETQ